MSSIETDTDELKRAIESKDTQSIINISVNNTNAQRQRIRSYFNSNYGKNLISFIKSKLTGYFKDTLISLFYDPIEYDCYELQKTIEGISLDKEILYEIIATRPVFVIKKIVKTYEDLFNKNLLRIIESNRKSGDIKKLLILLLQGIRSENLNPNQKQCEEYAKQLYDTRGKWGNDESLFYNIITSKSAIEFVLIAKIYHKLKGDSILKEIENEFTGDLKILIETIIYGLVNSSEYLATRVRKAINREKIDDNLLIRILVSRNKIDMPRIRQYYEQLYKVNMIEDIKEHTSGEYGNLLIKLASQ